MNILIAGGAGFIGSNLAEYLIKKRHKVIVLDNLITGSLENLSNFSKKIKFINQDITKSFKIKENIDLILHLASPASVKCFYKYPLEIIKANSFGTYNLLELARNKSSIFLFASTSEVYGDPKEHPQGENYFGNVNPAGIRSVYDEAKRFGETLTLAYFRKFNLNVKIIRIFNTYGPRMQKDDGRVIPTFINQALKGEPITIYGDGTQTRSFCYIKDLIEGIYKLIFCDYHLPVNLGNFQELSILKLIEIIKKITNSKSGIIYKDLPTDDPKRRRPDLKLAKKILNWEPIIPIEEGLKETIKWFNNRRL
ncbi:MAG: SDR family oxidoreductase [Armatimonadetes bacterium]|nr:SDR family oxidoreductase [Armatimonadota bacterium]